MNRRATAAVLAAVATLALAACGTHPGQSSTPTTSGSSTSGSASKTAVKTGTTGSSQPITEDTALHDELPASVKSAGKLVAVNSGSFPPYDVIDNTASGKIGGASGELEAALATLLGIKITNVTVSSLPTELIGMKTGRYSFDLGPDGDFTDREGQADFVDWVKEHVVFAVAKGNPGKITSLAATCGHKISVMAGGSAAEVLATQSATCKKEGKPAVQIQAYQDQPTALLAVRSGRAQAFFDSEAPLTYYIEQSAGLQLAGQGSVNGFPDLYQGAMVTKASLSKVLASAMKILFNDGTYAKVMDQWGLQKNMIPAPGIDLAAKAG